MASGLAQFTLQPRLRVDRPASDGQNAVAIIDPYFEMEVRSFGLRVANIANRPDLHAATG